MFQMVEQYFTNGAGIWPMRVMALLKAFTALVLVAVWPTLAKKP